MCDFAAWAAPCSTSAGGTVAPESRAPSSHSEHYNGMRPHRALHLHPPDPTRPVSAVRRGHAPATVQRIDVLGGLIHEYRHAA